MSVPRFLYALPLLFAVLGCAGPGGGPAPAATLGHLTLRQPLTIEPNSATLRVQYGRVVPRNGVEESEPFCVFELDTVAAIEQPLRPGRFDIVAIGQRVETFAGMPVSPFRRVAFDDDGPTHIYFKTIFRLRDPAPSRPQAVRALTCMSNQNAPGIAPFMRHLRPDEIRAALGGLFILELVGYRAGRVDAPAADAATTRLSPPAATMAPASIPGTSS